MREGTSHGPACERAVGRATVESRLIELWACTLQVPEVGVDDDFFELGGDSLLAAELQLALDNEFGVEIPASLLYRSATVAMLAEAIESAQRRQDAPSTRKAG
jgi:acyl carrier protein